MAKVTKLVKDRVNFKAYSICFSPKSSFYPIVEPRGADTLALALSLTH